MARLRSAGANGAARHITVPDSAGSNPLTTSSRVVFPAPFGPTNPRISPGRTEKLTSFSAMTLPKRRDMCRTSITTRDAMLLSAAGHLPTSGLDGGLGVEHALQRPGQVPRFAFAPVMEEKVARLLLAHVLMNGDDVDALLAHGMQHWLKLVLQHGEITIDKRCIVAAGKCRPSVDAHLLADGHAVHAGRTADHDLEHALIGLALGAECLLEGSRRDGAGRVDFAREGLNGGRIGGADLGNLVVDLLHAGGESLGVAHPANVHEVDLGLIKEEMVMQGRHLEARIKCSTHNWVHFVLKDNGVAHHHCPAMRWRERCP